MTTLTFHMTPNFVTEVTGASGGQTAPNQTGVWAYLWDNQPVTSGQNFTPLIEAGQLQGTALHPGTDGNYDVTVTLTNNSYVNGGVIYFLLQSEPLAGHTDLTTQIQKEGDIQPNSQKWHYGYGAFEYSLQGLGSDQGDLTAIDGFGPYLNLGVNVGYSDGSHESRGSALTGNQLLNGDVTATPPFPGGLKSLNNAANHTYAGGELVGDTSLFVSPSNGFFNNAASALWPTSVWDTLPGGTGTGYLTAFAGLNDVALSGVSNGEPDANLVWHNAQYYSYTVSAVNLAANTGPNGWGDAGIYFLFSPTLAASQTKGYMLISKDTLQSNLYAAGQGTATMWSSWDSATPANSVPYTIPGSGLPPGTPATDNSFNPSANNQFGSIFTNLFTGFTAGYWGQIGKQPNTFNQGTAGPTNLAAGPVNLDSTLNWSSGFAFDNSRSSPAPAYQHYDPYSGAFFKYTNIYGSAFSDNLSAGLIPGPLISLSQPGVTGETYGNNVGNIDLYVYGSTEENTNYTQPTGFNYLPPPSGSDYLVPATTVGSPLQLQVNGLSAGMHVRSDATLQLGIYKGKDTHDHATFEYVNVQTNGNLWQNFNVTGSQDAWTVTAGGKNVTGTFIISNLPVPATTSAGDVYWYQLVFGDGTPSDQKVYNIYATATGTVGQINTTAESVAADGGATFPPNTLTSTAIQLSLNPASSMASGLLTFDYNNQFSPAPAAPVGGTLSGGNNFTAVDHQVGTGLPTSLDGKIPGSGSPGIFSTTALDLAFGWTGTNNGVLPSGATPVNPVFDSTSHKYTAPGLVSEYTNKINPLDVAQIKLVDLNTDTPLPTVLTATADLDGQWQTSSTINLVDGVYSATMTELLSDGVTPFGPASFPLYIVVSATPGVTGTASQVSHLLDAYAAATPQSITISDNKTLTLLANQVASDAAALAVMQNQDALSWTGNVIDSAAHVAASLDAINGSPFLAHISRISFTDTGIPTIAITQAQLASDAAAIAKMYGARDLLINNVSGQPYSSYEYQFDFRNFQTGSAYFYTGISGQIYNAYEHDLDYLGRTTRLYFSGASGTYSAYEYDYEGGAFAGSKYYNTAVSGQQYTAARYDLDVNGKLTEFVGTVAAGLVTTLGYSTFQYEYVGGVYAGSGYFFTDVKSQPYTAYEHDLDASGRTERLVFTGVTGQAYSSYEYDYTGGVFQGSKYYFTNVSGQPYTTYEHDLNSSGLTTRLSFGGITSQAYSSYEYDYTYANGAYANGALTGSKYFYTDVVDQPYTNYELDLDASGQLTRAVYSGLTVTASQPYSSYEYDYSGGVLTGSKYYRTNIAGQDWTGIEQDLNAAGNIVRIVYTDISGQPYTSYENDYANGDGVLTGQKHYFTNVVNQGYSSYESDFVVAGSQTTQALAIYNMNDGGHTIQGMLSTQQTIDSIYNDITTGGTGADIFAYTPFFGQATITDFTAADTISLPTSEFASYDYLQSHNGLVGGNLMLTGSNGDTLTLQGVNALPGPSNFEFSS